MASPLAPRNHVSNVHNYSEESDSGQKEEFSGDSGEPSDQLKLDELSEDRNPKRIRRAAFQIERKFVCWCGKAYGSEGSLNQHKKLKRHFDNADQARENSEGVFDQYQTSRGIHSPLQSEPKSNPNIFMQVPEDEEEPGKDMYYRHSFRD